MKEEQTDIVLVQSGTIGSAIIEGNTIRNSELLTLSSTKAIFDNNGVITNIYEPLLEGESLIQGSNVIELHKLNDVADELIINKDGSATWIKRIEINSEQTELRLLPAPAETILPPEIVNQIPTYEGDNKLTVGGGVNPSKFEIGYKKPLENQSKILFSEILGSTVKNLIDLQPNETSGQILENGFIKYIANQLQLSTLPTKNMNLLQPNKVYTLLIEVVDYSLNAPLAVTLTGNRPFSNESNKDITTRGKYVYKVTSKSDLNNLSSFFNINTIATTGTCTFRFSLIEGDYPNASYIPFGLSTTEATIETQSGKYSFYEPVIKGETVVKDGKLVSLEPQGENIEGLPELGKVHNTIDVLDTATRKITSNTLQNTYIGIENWGSSVDNGQFMKFSLLTNFKLGGNYTINNMFKDLNQKGAISTSPTEECVWVYNHSEQLSSNYVYVNILKSRLSTQDVNGFKAWLQANPITVRYQLAEPTTIQLTKEQVDTYSQHRKVILLPTRYNKLLQNTNGSSEWVGSNNVNLAINDLNLVKYNAFDSVYAFSFNLPITPIQDSNSIDFAISNLFSQTRRGSVATSDVEGISMGVNSVGYIKINKNKMSDGEVETAKKYLQDNNFYLEYVPQSQSTTHIPKSLTPTIPINKINNFSVGGAVKPSKYSLTVPTHREPIAVNFKTPDIQDHINIKVVAVNEFGENNMADPVNIYVSPQPRWTFLLEENQVLLDWVDKFDFEMSYKIQYLVNGVDYHYDYVNSSDIELGGHVQHKFPLSIYDYATVRICCVSSQDHFYSKPITVSKDRDKTILPPDNFKYVWADKGLVEFSWKDSYTCEDGFEFTYSINEGSPVTEFIPSTTIEGAGTYTYRKQLEARDSILAKVRMKWDLNKSPYSSQSVIYIPTDAEPVKNLFRERTEEGIIIEWDAQSFVSKYEIHYIVGGEETIYETQYNSYVFDIDYSNEKLIEIYIITHVVGGAVSEKSDSILFTPTELKEIIETIKTDICRQDYLLHSAFTHVGTNIICHINTNTTDKTSQAYHLNTKNIERFQMEHSPVETTIWTKESKLVHTAFGHIANRNLTQVKEILEGIFSTPTEESYINESYIKTLINDGYTVNMEINKPRIATFGDSITAGCYRLALLSNRLKKNRFNCWNILRAL